MEKIQVFLDTDVIISALLSKTGASYELIKSPKVAKTTSKTVQKETNEVAKRLNLGKQETKRIFKNIRVTPPSLTKKEILEKYGKFVFDEKDSHVVAGANRAKSKFLLTHNFKHYQVNKIKAELGIIVLKPGNFLQYLRSLDRF